jgi:SAM-dependent methyltransferase
MKTIAQRMRRLVGSALHRAYGLVGIATAHHNHANLQIDEHKLRYLANEVSDLRALVRYLLPESASYRRYIAQTKASFTYQWANLPQGKHMLADEGFRSNALALLEQSTGQERGWFRGKKVLDAGCGDGRWSWAFCTAGAEVMAVDQSAVAVARVREACGSFPGFSAEVRDLLAPLEMPGAFDLVWCFGVLHHTGNTWLALRHVADAVKEGGLIYLMIYGEPRWEVASDFAGLNHWTELRRAVRQLPFDERVAYLEQLKGKELVHGWFDTSSPDIADLHRYDELSEWLRLLGFSDCKVTIPDRNLNLVATRRRREPAPEAAAP